MRSSSDWIQTRGGGWARTEVLQTRGLNRNHNATLQRIFKGAATTIVTRLDTDPCGVPTDRRSATSIARQWIE